MTYGVDELMGGDVLSSESDIDVYAVWTETDPADRDFIHGEAYAVIDAYGTMTFLRANSYAGGSSITDIKGVTHIGTVYEDIETIEATYQDDIPWYVDDAYELVERVRVANGQGIAPKSMAYWFYECERLVSVDLSGFNTSQVESLEDMFDTCTALTELDLSSVLFDVSQVTCADYMFYDCGNLKTIYTAPDAEWGMSGTMVFYGCESIEGGNGTAFDSSQNGVEMARVDGLGGSEGYFTAARTSSSLVTQSYSGSLIVPQSQFNWINDLPQDPENNE